jgi:hypothetical protein
MYSREEIKRRFLQSQRYNRYHRISMRPAILVHHEKRIQLIKEFLVKDGFLDHLQRLQETNKKMRPVQPQKPKPEVVRKDEQELNKKLEFEEELQLREKKEQELQQDEKQENKEQPIDIDKLKEDEDRLDKLAKEIDKELQPLKELSRLELYNAAIRGANKFTGSIKPIAQVGLSDDTAIPNYDNQEGVSLTQLNNGPNAQLGGDPMGKQEYKETLIEGEDVPEAEKYLQANGPKMDNLAAQLESLQEQSQQQENQLEKQNQSEHVFTNIPSYTPV